MQLPLAKLGDIVIIRLMQGKSIDDVEIYQTTVTRSWFENNQWNYEGDDDDFTDFDIVAVADPRNVKDGRYYPFTT